MANKTVVFDSNVWIGYFNTADSTHRKATQLFLTHADSTIVLTEYVLLEIATIIKIQLGWEAARTIVQALLATDNIVLLPSTQYFATTVKAFTTLDEPHLSFVDISLLVLAQDFLVETFDQKLKKTIKTSGIDL